MRGQIQIFTASLQRQLDEIADNVRETSVAAHRECLEIIASRDTVAAAEVARKHLQTWREWIVVNRIEGNR